MRGWIRISLLVVALAWAGTASGAERWTGRYTVRAGDSLTVIARHYGVSFVTLAEANRIDWRRPLLIGAVLHVPSTGRTTIGGAGTYVVRSGDTLSGIALRYHISLSDLATANDLDSEKFLLIGTRLRIPSGSMFDLTHIRENNPYRHDAVGFDISYPGCAAPLPVAQAFAIIGLNAGRPFTTNPCFDEQWEATRELPRSIYINTAYGETLFRHVTFDCLAEGGRQPLSPAAQRAYALGCSEAAAVLQRLSGRSPLAIWLDVESSNTWSSRRRLNAATITGILEHLFTHAPSSTIGVYSNADHWHSIVGDWSSLSVPEWVAPDGPDPPGCPAAFASGPVWLSQSIDGQRDIDTVC